MPNPSTFARLRPTGDASADQLRSLVILYDKESHLDDRALAILRYRLGIVDGEIHSLEETGRLFDLTRERVRQIEGKALAVLQRQAAR